MAVHRALALHGKLAAWVNSKPRIAALYIFGPSARPNHPPASGLDLAVEFEAVENELVEFLLHRDIWQWELVALLGLAIPMALIASNASAETIAGRASVIYADTLEI